MQIQIVTDNHVGKSEGLKRHVESVVANALERFGHRVTRVEVHLGDENSHKTGGEWCAMEAKLAGLQPVTVNAQASNLDQAIDAAADKLVKVLDRTIDKKQDPKGRRTVRKEPSAKKAASNRIHASSLPLRARRPRSHRLRRRRRCPADGCTVARRDLPRACAVD
jgi:ribosomal subunit interface protein